jgi:hypothetical protein
MKSYTDLEQSKKLAEILPLESADMHYSKDFDGRWFVDLAKYTSVKVPKYVGNIEEHLLPCWSLAALLNVLELPTLEKCNIGKDKTGWMVTVYHNNSRYDSFFYNEPVDACYEVILKLNELKML